VIAASALTAFSPKFFAGQFAVPVFVEFAERRGSVVDFIGINDAVAIGIERGDDGTSFTTAMAFSGFILSVESENRGANCGGCEQVSAFHIVFPMQEKTMGWRKGYNGLLFLLNCLDRILFTLAVPL
jgi:hypothetical protein